MSAALLLVRDSDGGSSPPPLVAWELFMRRAGRSERTVCDGVATMQRLERNAGKGCDTSSRRSTCRGSSPTPTSERRRGRPTSVRSARSIAGGQRKAARTSLPAAVAALAEAIAAAGVVSGPGLS